MKFDPLEAAAVLAAATQDLRDEFRRFAQLVADTSNDPHLVREAERILAERP